MLWEKHKDLFRLPCLDGEQAVMATVSVSGHRLQKGVTPMEPGEPDGSLDPDPGNGLSSLDVAASGYTPHGPENESGNIRDYLHPTLGHTETIRGQFKRLDVLNLGTGGVILVPEWHLGQSSELQHPCCSTDHTGCREGCLSVYRHFIIKVM